MPRAARDLGRRAGQDGERKDPEVQAARRRARHARGNHRRGRTATKGGTQVKRDIEFMSKGSKVRGWLIMPDDSPGPYPVVVMAGGWCYVKEVVMPHYAEYFVRQGLATLIFDYRNLGASEAEPRQHLDPWAQIEDYSNAINFAETQTDLDSDRIGVWGISYSGGHALILAAIEPRIKCAVSNIAVIDGYQNM